jgi:hypothetical protein
MPDRPLVSLDIATNVRQLSEEVAEVVGYQFQTTHICMECGVRISNGGLVRHAREHAGIPAPQKAKGNGQAD